jgi:hypothetical protein
VVIASHGVPGRSSTRRKTSSPTTGRHSSSTRRKYWPSLVEAAPIEEVAEWAEGFRQFWDASYARLDNYLERMKEKEKKHDKPE